MIEEFSRMARMNCFLLLLWLLPVCWVLPGCLVERLPPNKKEKKQSILPEEREDRPYDRAGKMFSGDVVLFGEQKTQKIHPELWHSAMKVVSGIPLQSSNMDRGIIETKWYQAQGYPNEQFRIIVSVFPSGTIRAHDLHVDVFRRFLAKGVWKDAGHSVALEKAIKEAILLRVRESSSANRYSSE